MAKGKAAKGLLDELLTSREQPQLDPRFDPRVKEQERLRALQTTVAERGTQDVRGIPLADLEGRPFVTTMSDRTRAGGLLTHINQVPLRDPVNLQGGQGFMFENPGQVWASAKNVVKQQQRAAKAARAETGQDPLFIPWRMAPTGQDFATMSGEAMLGYAATNMGKGTKRGVNALMKELIPNWPGIDSPDSISAFRAAPAKARKQAKAVLDRDFRDAGGLGLGEARLAVADPAQRSARDGGIQSVGRISPNAPIITESGHPSYPAGLPGEGLGRINQDVGIYELLPELARQRGVLDTLNPGIRDLRALQMKPYVGRITPEILRSLEARGIDVSKPALVASALGLGAAGAPEEAEAGPAQGLLSLLQERARQGPVRVGGNPLPGAPSQPNIPGGGPMIVGQNPDAIRAAESYAERSGIPYTPLSQYVQVDPERGSRIARAYERMPHSPDDPRTAAAYRALADETMGQYESMLSAGVEPYFIRGRDPYAASPYLSLLDLAENRRLGVFPTDEGFGTEAGFDATGNPLLARSPFKIGGEPAAVNDIFRAVHDYYGHAKPGVGFRAMGEENAYQSHAGMYSPLARQAAATETRGQNSWLNFGPYGERNRTAGIDDTVFADQKTGLLPNWAVNEGLTTAPRAPVSEALRPAINPRGMLELTHYSHNPLDIVDPAKAGTGLTRNRPESQRSMGPDGVPRSYYGIDRGVENPYRREAALGGVANTAELAPDLLYDYRADPDRLRTGSTLDNERAVRDAGYSGYWADDPRLGKVAVVFDPLEARRLKQGGYAGPIVMAGAGVAGAGLMGLLSAMGSGQTAVADAEAQGSRDALLGIGNLGEGTAREGLGYLSDLVSGVPEYGDRITGGQVLPTSPMAGPAAEGLMGLLGGIGRQIASAQDAAYPAITAALEYDPPLAPPVGNQVQGVVDAIGDAWGGLSESAKTRLIGAGGLASMFAPLPGKKAARTAKRRKKSEDK